MAKKIDLRSDTVTQPCPSMRAYMAQAPVGDDAYGEDESVNRLQDYCKALIEEAWYYKFQQGGGMHQAGILAAGCLYGLKHHLKRIVDVHFLAKKMARGLQELSSIEIDPTEVETNILIFKLNHPRLKAPQLQSALLEKGIRILALDDTHIRMMTHLDHTSQEIQEALEAIQKVLR